MPMRPAQYLPRETLRRSRDLEFRQQTERDLDTFDFTARVETDIAGLKLPALGTVGEGLGADAESNGRPSGRPEWMSGPDRQDAVPAPVQMAAPAGPRPETRPTEIVDETPGATMTPLRGPDDADGQQQPGYQMAGATSSRPAPMPSSGGAPYTPAAGPSTAAGSVGDIDNSSRQSFVRTAWPYALEAAHGDSNLAELILAKAISENGSIGTGRPIWANNFSGIKGEGDAGSVEADTWESVNGQRVNIKDRFAAYSSPRAGFAAFWQFLENNNRYHPALARYQQTRDADQLMRDINAAGYATDPNWAESVRSIRDTQVAPLVRGQQPAPEMRKTGAAEVPETGMSAGDQKRARMGLPPAPAPASDAQQQYPPAPWANEPAAQPDELQYRQPTDQPLDEAPQDAASAGSQTFDAPGYDPAAYEPGYTAPEPPPAPADLSVQSGVQYGAEAGEAPYGPPAPAQVDSTYTRAQATPDLDPWAPTGPQPRPPITRDVREGRAAADAAAIARPRSINASAQTRIDNVIAETRILMEGAASPEEAEQIRQSALRLIDAIERQATDDQSQARRDEQFRQDEIAASTPAPTPRGYWDQTDRERDAFAAAGDQMADPRPVGPESWPAPVRRELGRGLGALQGIGAASEYVTGRADYLHVPLLIRRGILEEHLSPQQLERYKDLSTPSRMLDERGLPRPLTDAEFDELNEFHRYADRKYQEIKDDPDQVNRYYEQAPGSTVLPLATGLAALPFAGALAGRGAAGAAARLGASARTARAVGYGADVAVQAAGDPTNLITQPAFDAAIQGVRGAARAGRALPDAAQAAGRAASDALPAPRLPVGAQALPGAGPPSHIPVGDSAPRRGMTPSRLAATGGDYGWAARWTDDMAGDVERGTSSRGWGVQPESTEAAARDALRNVGHPDPDGAMISYDPRAGGYIEVDDGLSSYFGASPREAVDNAMRDADRFEGRQLYIYPARHVGDDEDAMVFGAGIARTLPIGQPIQFAPPTPRAGVATLDPAGAQALPGAGPERSSWQVYSRDGDLLHEASSREEAAGWARQHAPTADIVPPPRLPTQDQIDAARRTEIQPRTPAPAQQPPDTSTERLGTRRVEPGSRVPPHDFRATDLDTGDRPTTAEVVRQTYAGRRKGVDVYESYVPLDELPAGRIDNGPDGEVDALDEYMSARGRQGFPAIKVRVDRDGKVTILDGNHRVEAWRQAGYDYAPVWVIDERPKGVRATPRAGVATLDPAGAQALPGAGRGENVWTTRSTDDSFNPEWAEPGFLAEAGIPTASPSPRQPSGTLYHLTPVSRLEGVSRDGLGARVGDARPTEQILSSGERVRRRPTLYAADNARILSTVDRDVFHSEEWALLRFPRGERRWARDPEFPKDEPGSWVTRTSVSPDEIEVYTPAGWRPLRTADASAPRAGVATLDPRTAGLGSGRAPGQIEREALANPRAPVAAGVQAVSTAGGGITGALQGDENTTWDQRTANALMGAGVGFLGGGKLGRAATVGSARLLDNAIKAGKLTPDILEKHPDPAKRIMTILALAAEGLDDAAPVAVPAIADFVALHAPRESARLGRLLSGQATAGEIRQVASRTLGRGFGQQVAELMDDILTGKNRRAFRASENRADAAAVRGLPEGQRGLADSRTETYGREVWTHDGTGVETNDPRITTLVNEITQSMGVRAPVKVFVIESPVPNAHAMIGTDAQPAIAITRGAIDRGVLSSEVRGLLQHEAGHIGEDVARAAAGGGRAPATSLPGVGPKATPPFDDVAPPFYSQLRRVLDDKMPNRASPQQIAGIIKGGAVKPDEVAWTGLDDWLREQTGPVTKKQVMGFLDKNEVKIEEIVRGDRPVLWDSDGGGTWTVRNTPSLRVIEDESGAFHVYHDAKRSRQSFRSLEDAQAAAEDLVGTPQVGGVIDNSGSAAYGQYTVPGGENYRELLLTYPKGDTEAYDVAFPPDRRHWRQPNVLAHVRFSERAMPDGRRALHIEEVQSDWHQAGRKRGYGPGTLEEARSKYTVERISTDGAADIPFYEGGTWDDDLGDFVGQRRVMPGTPEHDAMLEQMPGTRFVLRGPSGAIDQYASRAAAEQAIEGHVKSARSIPAAPFQKTWPELAIKRMMRWAAENDFDRVIWTGGVEQAARYPGTPKEGMVGFYDKILPETVNNLVKKFDGRVTRAALEDGERVVDAWSVDVTPRMRESVMKQGQPMFAGMPFDPTGTAAGGALGAASGDEDATWDERAARGLVGAAIGTAGAKRGPKIAVDPKRVAAEVARGPHLGARLNRELKPPASSVPISVRVAGKLTDAKAPQAWAEDVLRGMAGEKPLPASSADRPSALARVNPGSVADERIRAELEGPITRAAEAGLQDELPGYLDDLAQQDALDSAYQAGREAFEAKHTGKMPASRLERGADRAGQAAMRRAQQGGPGGTYEDIVARVEATRERATTAGTVDALDEAAEAVWEHNRQTLARLRDAGDISQAEHDAILAAHPHLVPTVPIMGLDPSGAGPTGRVLNRFGGQGKGERLNPIVASRNLTVEAERAAAKNQVFTAFSRLIDDAVNAGGLTLDGSRRLWDGNVPVSGMIDGKPTTYYLPKPVADALESAGAQGVDSNAWSAILKRVGGFVTSTITAARASFLPVNLARDVQDYATRTAAKEGGAHKIPAVLLTWADEAGKAARDIASANANVRGGIGAASGAAAGAVQGDEDTTLGERVRNAASGAVAGTFLVGANKSRATGAARELAARGGGMGRLDSGWRAGQRWYRDVLRDGGQPVRTPGDAARWLGDWAADIATLKGVKGINERTEMIPRTAAMRRADQRGAGVTEAMIAGRDATVDFDRGGTVIRAANGIIPFLNATVQGGAQTVRLFRDHPKEATAVMLATLGPSLIAAEAWNRSDPERARVYDDVPQYVKDSGLVVVMPWAGSDARGERPNYLWIPTGMATPFMIAGRDALLANAPGLEPTAGRVGIDPDAPALIRWGSILSEVASVFSPVKGDSPAALASSVVPPVGKQLLELGLNRDMYRGAPVASDSADERASAFSQGVSGAANAAGRMLGSDALQNVRPSQVEYLTRQLPAYGDIVTGASDMIAPRPSRADEDRPIQNAPFLGGIAGRFVRDTGGANLDRARDARLTEGARSVLEDAGLPPSTIKPVPSTYKGAMLTRDEQLRWQEAANAALDDTLAAARDSMAWDDPTKREQAVSRAITRARDLAARDALSELTDAEIRDRIERAAARKAG